MASWTACWAGSRLAAGAAGAVCMARSPATPRTAPSTTPQTPTAISVPVAAPRAVLVERVGWAAGAGVSGAGSGAGQTGGGTDDIVSKVSWTVVNEAEMSH